MKNQILIATIGILVMGCILFSQKITTPQAQSLKQFDRFLQTYSRAYDTDEKAYRFQIFAQNLEKIQKHNSDKTQTYTLGINQFADMTPEEFVGKILMNDLKDYLSPYVQRQGLVGPVAPQAIDWRSKSNVINPVKNQGQCGSCWAFSTVGVLESTIAISTNVLNNFAEQQLVDCCGDQGYQCLGCNGAWPQWALNYVNHYGIVQQNQYPYTAKKGTCKETPTAKKFLNQDHPWTMLNRGDIGSLKTAVSNGPVSISIDASNWYLYRSGVFSNCGTSTLNHAVVVIGYQSDGTWIVRNSWGASWGEQGYIRLSAGNTCGITQHAVIPTLA